MGTSSSRGSIAGRRPRRPAGPAPYPLQIERETRRRLGSYYTPRPLVDHLVRAALAPLLPALRRAARGAKGGRLDDAPLPRILDPAMGEGIFLRAAADLIAGMLSAESGRSAEETRPLVVARCLNGVDIDPVAVSMARRALGAGAERAVLIHDDFLAEGAPVNGPFDVVLGNPPWGGWNRTLSREARVELRARFATARGLIDPFALFLERSTTMLVEGGRLAMVLPDYFLLKNYPAARRHVLDNYRIEELAHWGQVFDGVNLDACTIVATRDGAHRNGWVRCLPEGPAGPRVRVPQSRFAAAPGFLFNLSLDGRGAALLLRLQRECVPLGELLETHEGIHSGNVRLKLFVPPRGRAPRGARLRRLILGRAEIRPFRLRPAGWRVVYDRSVVDRARGEYANLGRESWFTSPKILIRRTGDAIFAALDDSALFASNNLFVALPREGSGVPLEYLEAYLNSSLATWCFRALQPRVGRLFAELKLVHLNRLPVPLPRGAAARRRIARIVALARRLRRSPGGPRPRDLNELDEAFARLAGLTAEQRRLIARKSFPRAGSSPL